MHPQKVIRSALVTGASSGIGRAMALRLARDEWDVTLVARDREELEKVANLAERSDGRARVIPADLTLPAARVELASQIERERFDAVVLAAGYGLSGPFVEGRTRDELNMIELNCSAVVELTRAAARSMDHGGSIVLFSSLVGWQGVPMSATYAATKAFVQSLGEALSVELAHRSVRVLTCAPGPVHSGFASRASMTLGSADEADKVAADIMRRLGKSGTMVPGRMGKMLTFGLRSAPRWLRVRIMGRIMAGMARVGERPA